MIGDVPEGDRLIAVRAERAGVEPGSGAVAVVAPLLAEGAGVAFGAVIDGDGASWCARWRSGNRVWRVVAVAPGCLPAGGGAVALAADRGERVAADRAVGCRLVVVRKRRDKPV